MAPKLSKVGSATGSPMGRRDVQAERRQRAFKFYLQRVPINSQGYDSGGAYWGVGKPLWQAVAEFWDEETKSWDSPSHYFRETDRNAAKTHLRKLYPNCAFYR